jgi:hypothetical protein
MPFNLAITAIMPRKAEIYGHKSKMLKSKFDEKLLV